MTIFTVAEEVHFTADAHCTECYEGYPARCRCGGLMHAASGAGDPDGDVGIVTRCDRCGRSDDDE